MTVEYQLTPDDFTTFNLYHFNHSPTARRQYYRGLLLPVVVWLSIWALLWYRTYIDSGAPLQAFLDLLPLLVFVPLYLLAYPWLRRRTFRQTVSTMANEGSNRDLFGWHRVSVRDEGITEEGQHSRSTFSWDAVEKVAMTDDHVYVYVSAMAAIIIPRRAFASEAEWRELADTLARLRPRS
jgi:hypothetical protein